MSPKIEETTFDNLDLPETVYKYRTWNDLKHKTIIADLSVYFANPNDFEDPIDCKVPIRYDLLTERDILAYFLYVSKRDFPERSRQQHREYARYWSERTPVRNKTRIMEMQRESMDRYNEHNGILSLTANPGNLQMWKKYAEDHEGFVIGFNPHIMFKFLGGGSIVQYRPELPIIYPTPKHSYIEQTFYQIYFKLDKWGFEEEYRTHIFKPSILKLEDRIVKLPKEAYTEIILGAKMSKANTIDILEEVKKNLEHIKVRQAVSTESEGIKIQPFNFS
jgi:hypothetical protein